MKIKLAVCFLLIAYVILKVIAGDIGCTPPPPTPHPSVTASNTPTVTPIVTPTTEPSPIETPTTEPSPIELPYLPYILKEP